MAKIIAKQDINFINGQLVTSDNEIVYMPEAAYEQLDKLEESVQRAKFLLVQPKAQPMPTMDNFVRAHVKTNVFIEAPKMKQYEQEIKRAKVIDEEIAARDDVNAGNELLTNLRDLCDWVTSDFVVDGNNEHPAIDTVEIGNPLELTADKLIDYAKLVVKAARHQQVVVQ